MSQRTILAVVMVFFLAAFLLSACTPARTPADVIESYLKALAESDQASAVSNSCADWEEKATAEGASFINVEVTLEDLSCQAISQSDTEAIVSCSGRFISSYTAGEDQELDLSALNFSLVNENGEWRMCGYSR